VQYNIVLRDTLLAAKKIPVLPDNNNTAQAFCEYKFGAGMGYDSMIFLTIITGTGAALLLM